MKDDIQIFLSKQSKIKNDDLLGVKYIVSIKNVAFSIGYIEAQLN